MNAILSYFLSFRARGELPRSEIFRSHSSATAYVLVIVFIFGINYNRNDFLGALNLNLEDDKENENDDASQAGEGTESTESQSAAAASATPAIITPALSLTDTLTPSTGRLLQQQWHRLRRLPQHRPFLNLRSTSTDAQGRPRTSLCS